jgi:hypothetical protein
MNVVYKSTYANMEKMWNFEVMSYKFNVKCNKFFTVVVVISNRYSCKQWKTSWVK